MKIYSNGKDRVLTGAFPARFKLLNAGVEVPFIRTGKKTVRLSGDIPFGELDVEEVIKNKTPQPAKLDAQSIAVINKSDFDQIDILSKKLAINQEQMNAHLSALTEQEATLANLETQNAQSIDQTNLNMAEMAKAFGKEIQADRDALVATSENIKQVLSETAEVLDAKLQAHEVAKNPHKITKAMVGLDAVDNTSDLDKPISKATQKALDKKADKADIENLDKRLLESDKKQDTLMRNLETVNLYGGVGGNELPTGGKKGQVLAKKSNKDGDYVWSSAGGGVSVHNELSGRSASDAHPISAITGLQSALTGETTNRENADNGLQSQIDAITASSDVKDIVGTYAQLEAYDTSTLGNNDIIKVLQDETHSDETTYYRWSTSTETFTLIGEEGPYYTKSEANSTFVPQTRTVNGQALSADISLTASDVGALPDSTDLSNFVTLNTSQKIQAAKAIFGTDVAFGSDTTQKNLLAVVSNNNSTAGNWIGRLTVGAKNKTFIMGTYGGICVLGAHAWTNAQQGTGAAWEPVYINPDGDKAVYIGGSPINGKQAMLVIQNVNANTTGTVKINRSTNLTNNFKDVACWGDDISKFNNDAGYTTNIGTVTSVNNTSPDANGNVTISVLENTATGTGALTILGTASTATNAINIGTSTTATKYAGISIGYNTNSTGSYAITIGESTNASGNQAIAIGRSARANFDNSVSIGYSSDVSNSETVAVGYDAEARGYCATCLGSQAQTGVSQQAISLGYKAHAEANYAIQIGYGTNSTAKTLAVGFNNTNYTLLNGTTGLIPPERLGTVSATAGNYYAKINVDGLGNVTQSWEAGKSDNISSWATNVTNCITEAPQDLVFELNSGTLTLKSGSKVCVPNGSGTFDFITTTEDKTVTRSDSNDCMVWYNTSGTLQVFPVSLFRAGSTSPTGSTYMFWYDTTNNKCKVTSNGGSTWSEGKSFPLALLGTDGTKISEIKRVFNGFGYVSSTIFCITGTKGSKPNGRNTDGTLSNTYWESASVVVRNFSASDNYAECVIGFDGSAFTRYNRTNYSYRNDTNLNYSSGSLWNTTVIGTVTLTNGVISNFNIKPVFHALDYFDVYEVIKQISGYSPTKTQTLKNVNGTLTWVDDS